MIGQMFSPEGVHVSIQMTRWSAAPALYLFIFIYGETHDIIWSSQNLFKLLISYELNDMRDRVFLLFLHFSKINENVAFLFNN